MNVRGKVWWVAAAVLGGAVAAVAAVPAAHAMGTAGKCTTSSGASVAVDYYDLGPATPVTRCSTSTGTALQVLQGAGFTPTGTQRWGLAFICRINGHPTSTQYLSIPGNTTYQEKCINTPPASAYWALWVASNGGTWKLAPYGATTQQVAAGQWEGWAWEHNRSQTTLVPPRVTPTR